jgi:DNA-binding CsgD family transcriptional regulator
MTNPIHRLSRRQSEVLYLIIRGFRNREIALQLGLSERLVKACASELFLLFDASNRTELAGMVALQVLPGRTVDSRGAIGCESQPLSNARFDGSDPS